MISGCKLDIASLLYVLHLIGWWNYNKGIILKERNYVRINKMILKWNFRIGNYKWTFFVIV